MPAAQWVIFAIASGACAAINGTFAKLTTTSLTTSISTALADLLSLPESYESVFEYIVRGAFFALNLLFDALMWGLFTRALTLAQSTVHVSVLNTATNFLTAAGAGWAVFGERLPGLWWVGAGMLIAGCGLVGSRDGKGAGTEAERLELQGRMEPEGDGWRNSEGSSIRERSPYRDEGEGH